MRPRSMITVQTPNLKVRRPVRSMGGVVLQRSATSLFIVPELLRGQVSQFGGSPRGLGHRLDQGRPQAPLLQRRQSLDG